ncbi:ABC transporter permease [Paenibacillus koleovorans]|uniref:ABC transporter permease n=1 Tax=Paenibacillus koleovorans TaxID=121608 RepID=UPI001FE848AC|nr:ABC-2 family transporter protein [Paenibacillus koleovorans]
MSMEADARGSNGRLLPLLKVIVACWKLNLAGALEYRLSFFLTAGMMFVNNIVWIFYWGVYFHRFQVVNGWTFEDVMMMWAIGAGGFGVAAVLFGNCFTLAGLIANGQLETFLVQPKPVLPHVLVSRMSVSAIGDVVFGLGLYGMFGQHSAGGLLKFGIGLLLATLLFICFNLLVQSLAFYMGNAEALGMQLNMGFLTFATYPTDIFRGAGKLLLFTLVPAGFISYIPIGLLKTVEWPFAFGLIGASLVLLTGSSVLFYRGLRHYSSGNQVTLRM